MKITLKIWRQKNKGTKGSFKEYKLDHVSPDMSFLEMLDVLNTDLILKGEESVAFDHDCREGFVVPVASTLTVALMAHNKLRPVSST